MRYKLVLFDADGTLFDFDTAEKQAFEKTFKQFGINENLELLHKEYEIINKAIWRDFEQKKITSRELRTERFRRFFVKENLDLDPKVISPIYLRYLSEGTHLLQGAKEIISFLFGKCELALATNGLADVQNPRFAGSDLAKYFQHIFISEEIGHPKPNPEFFEHIFRKLPHKESAIIIGDNLVSDIMGGNDFGIDTCWFNPNKRINESGVIPAFEISDLKELRSILI
ncbi:MAG: YjjG family noncanonical pyrimidine nucleotidase [Candidatus Cloacimonetes bacterium]|nr:YjjG family noncanonical pyrimidine nucleotidase [Candidatus Cloacimonadota bacterium]